MSGVSFPRTPATTTLEAAPGVAGGDLADEYPDALIRLDAAGRILEANQAAMALTGYPRDALVGASCAAMLAPQTPDGAAVLADGYHRSARLRSVSGVPEQPVRIVRAGGDEVPVFVTVSYQRDASGRVVGALLAIRSAARRARQAPTGIEIVSTVSHELRSPLTSVKGYTGLLLSRWDRLHDDQKLEMLEQVNHDADRVKRLIDELLDISRLETGRLHLHRQMVDLSEIVATVVGKVTMEYPSLEARVRFSDDVPEVYADPDKLTQVLTNLVENACKYASPVGLTITAEVSSGDARIGEVAVAVTDRGEGIPPSDLPKVFDKFFRRDLGRPTGSGLGLWISRGLVQVHGGRLTASSVPGQGTTFRFTLPLYSFEDLHPT
jgi:PAS domain S-box-containing protein